MRYSRMITLAAVAGAVLLATPAGAQRQKARCEDAVAAEIAQLQIDPARIGSISYTAQKSGGGDDGNARTSRILGWIDLNDCTGQLVMDMTPRCVFKQAYTTDECTVEGLSSC